MKARYQLLFAGLFLSGCALPGGLLAPAPSAAPVGVQGEGATPSLAPTPTATEFPTVVLPAATPPSTPSPSPTATPTPGPLEPKQIAGQSFPSVVFIVMGDESAPTSQGSGFFVGTDLVATNYHVIEGKTRGAVKIIDQPAAYEIEGVVAYDKVHDLAILKIRGVNAKPLPLGTLKGLAVGDRVYAIGSPKGLEGTFSDGLVSSIRQGEADTVVQISAPISPGSSGGPVLNDRGEVIGVASFGVVDGQNLNFAQPVNYLEILMAKISAVTPLSSLTPRETPAAPTETPPPPLERVRNDYFILKYDRGIWSEKSIERDNQLLWLGTASGTGTANILFSYYSDSLTIDEIMVIEERGADIVHRRYDIELGGVPAKQVTLSQNGTFFAITNCIYSGVHIRVSLAISPSNSESDADAIIAEYERLIRSFTWRD